MIPGEIDFKIAIDMERFRKQWPDFFAPPSNEPAIEGLQQIIKDLEEQ